MEGLRGGLEEGAFGIAPSLFALTSLPGRKGLWPYCIRVDKEAFDSHQATWIQALKGLDTPLWKHTISGGHPNWPWEVHSHKPFGTLAHA